MAEPVIFGSDRIIEPGSHARTVGGVTPAGAAVSSGKIIIIDTGEGATWGGGKGVIDAGTSNPRSLDDFLVSVFDSLQMREHVKGGFLWDLAQYLYNPSNQEPGAGEIYIARAAATEPGSSTHSFSNTFDLTFTTVEEGQVVNGQLDSQNNNLYKGYGFTIEQGRINSSAIVIKFWLGTFRGTDPDGNYYDGRDEVEAGQFPRLLYTTPELETVGDLQALYNEDPALGQFLEIDFSNASSSDAFNGSSDATSGYELFSGGTESYSTMAEDEILSRITDLDNSLFLSLKKGDDADGSFNSKIIGHIVNEAEFKKFLYTAGGDNEVEFDASSTGTIDSANNLNSEYVFLMHGAQEVPHPVTGNMVHRDARYFAAQVCGMAGGVQPQTPLTHNPLRIYKQVHKLTKDQRIQALQNGVVHLRTVDQIGIVVNQYVTTLQKNLNLINQNGTSYEGSVMRIQAQLNRILQEGAHAFFVGNNVVNANEADLIAYTRKTLENNVAVPGGQDGLILGFSNIRAQRQGTSWFVTYDFQPNSPINKTFHTGTMIDSTL